jgi:ketosteroid isomerase-like protein
MVAWVVGMIVGCGADYQGPDPMILIQNETEFQAAVAAKGMRDGFLDYLADDGVLFVPGAVNGKEHYSASPQRAAILNWVPVYAEMSSGGDFGYTTGPWDWREDSTVTEPQAYGQYVTIWKLQPDSTWKFVLDIGTAHSAPLAPPTSPVTKIVTRPDDLENINLAQERSNLIDLERAFAAAAVSQGLVAAYMPTVCDDVRFMRMGKFPVKGVSDLTTALSQTDGVLTWRAVHCDLSQSADLGYTFGVSRLVVGDTVTKFSYAHIWRKGADGLWRLALDIQIPLPEATEETS